MHTRKNWCHGSGTPRRKEETGDRRQETRDRNPGKHAIVFQSSCLPAGKNAPLSYCSLSPVPRLLSPVPSFLSPGNGLVAATRRMIVAVVNTPPKRARATSRITTIIAPAPLLSLRLRPRLSKKLPSPVKAVLKLFHAEKVL